MHKDSPHLDGQYAGFGMVIEGIENVDKIAESETNIFDKPEEPQVIDTMVMDMNGYDFEEPAKM
jgi:peptidyl-prolyl cis-trans isomerase B (cyclophilin B)